MDISIAEAFEKENDWEKALEEYRKLLDVTPNNLLYREKVGWCLSRLQQFDDSIEIFKTLSANEPQKAKWDYMIGYQYYSKKEWKTAIEWFRNALQKYPNYFIVKYRLGYALTQCSGTTLKLKSPEYLEAYKHFNECEAIWNAMSENDKLSEKAHFADVCFQKGKILIERKNWDLAIECLEKAVDMYPDNCDYNYCYAKALSGKGDNEKAFSIIKKFKGKYYIEELKAELLNKLGKQDQAINIYKEILEKRKKDYLFREIAEIYLIRKDLKTAFVYAKKAVGIGSQNHINYFILGKIYFEAELYISSKDMFQKAIQLKKDKYNSDYNEASDMLCQTLNIIDNQNLEEDNEEILKDLLNEDNSQKQGKIIKYNRGKGFGFINSDNERYFFHISQIPKSNQAMVCEDMDVLFYSTQTEKGNAAKDITIYNNTKLK